MSDEEVVEMEVFRAGDYGPRGKYGEGEIEALARDYSPEVHEAPLTLDHAQNGPAVGWVRALRRAGDRLVAAVTGIPAAVRGVLRDGLYKKRSVELVRAHPATGRPYLRAVSLLGAASPAVEGLREVAFGGEEGAVEQIAFADPDAPRAEPAAAAGSAVAQVRVLAEKVARLRSRAAEREADILFADLRRDGVCMAGEDEAMVRRLVFAACAGEPPEAADAGDVTEWLRRFLGARALRLPAGEVAPEPAAATPDPRFAASAADPRSVALHRAATALVEADPALTYAAALARAARTAS